MSDDDALDALLLPFERGHLDLPAPGRGLFLRAEWGRALAPWRDRLVCEQTFKPLADILAHKGFRLADDIEAEMAECDVALVRLTRDRRESRGLLTRAWRRLAANGILVAAGAKTEGAQSIERAVARLMPLAGVLPKHGCRVFWLGKAGTTPAFAEALRDWEREAAPRLAVEGRFTSMPGLFSWDRVDDGSRLLAERLPDDLSGRVADLGCGWGYISARLIEHGPGIRQLDLYEAERLALDCARINLAAIAHPAERSFHWHDVTAGLPTGRSYDAVVMNPPFHLGRAGMPSLGQSFIRAAESALKPRGRLFLVANRHLPYEATLVEAFGAFETIADERGFKVLAARR